MGVTFDSPKEFKAVMDRVFGMMDDDPEMGPKLRDADVPMRYDFEDVDLVVNIRAARPDEDGNLHWEWTDDVVEAQLRASGIGHGARDEHLAARRARGHPRP